MTVAAARRATASDRFPRLLFVAAMLCVGAFLLLCRLDDALLWQDEAETAIVARHLLAYGLPISTDGTDWVQQAGEPFVEFTRDYVWIYHSWLQYALAAASFALLGLTTLAARLPSALVGAATLAAFYAFIFRWTRDVRIARVAGLLLVLCVPFVLLLRQCRYYSLAAFFTLLTLDAYLRLSSHPAAPWTAPYFILSAVLLYHSHYAAFFPTMAALAIEMLLTRAGRKSFGRVIPALVITGLLVLPWAVFMRVWERGEPFRLDRFLGHIGQHLVYVTAWLFPLALLLLLPAACGGLTSRRAQAPEAAVNVPESNAAGGELCRLAGLVITINVLSVSAAAAFDWVFFRYWTHLIPLVIALLAVVIIWVLDHRPALAYTLMSVLLLSNALHLLPYGLPGMRQLNMSTMLPGSAAFRSLQEVWVKAGRFRSDVWMYAQELTHTYEGPNEGLLAYLSTHAEPGQTVAVNYEDLPLMFYSELQVIGGLSAHGLDRNPQPDWVISRKYGPYRDRLAAIVESGSYERIEIPHPDIRWENRPEPGEHHYLTVRDADNVVLYRRQGD